MKTIIFQKRIRFTKLVISYTILIATFNACNRSPMPAQEISGQEIKSKSQKRVTIFLVDRSGSFHKFQKQGNFKNKDYFLIACDQIKEYVETKADRQNELVLVRGIESASFSDDTFIAKIDFGQQAPFGEPEPKGAYSKMEKEDWQERKKKYESHAEDQQASLLKDFFSKLLNLRNMSASDETDVVNAFKALKPHLKEFEEYSKQIVVYSDFRDTQTELESAGEIDLGPDTEVEGRFVSMNQQDPESYDSLLSAWRRILKCKSIRFKTPAESV